MPRVWVVMMAVLAVCLIASVAIGTVRLITTPTELIDVPPSFTNQDWRELMPPR
jgi:hypothetical protein